MGLSLAYRLCELKGDRRRILIIEKESDVAMHASGRNSGVLHAGIYYGSDSLKARFCRQGSMMMKRYCQDHGLAINRCGKLIVSKDEKEEKRLFELYEMARVNGAKVALINQKQVNEIDRSVKTFSTAIWSPETASISPKAVCHSLHQELTDTGVDFAFNSPVTGVDIQGKTVETQDKRFSYDTLINTAGLYADKIAQCCGVTDDYALLPFKGIYFISRSDTIRLKTNVYPVPDPQYPFLGVHFTITVDGRTKIGPTAIPALWREHYSGIERFKAKEFGNILNWYMKSVVGNHFNFRALLASEAKYLFRGNLLKEAQKMVNLDLAAARFVRSAPGIRAQLYDKRHKRLVNDFIIEHKQDTIHVLNAVSPAFTSAFAMADYIIKEKLC